MKSLEISKSSWHYRFITWRRGWEPHPSRIADSCSYWRMLMGFMFGFACQWLAIIAGAIFGIFICILMPIHGVGFYLNWWDLNLGKDNAFVGMCFLLLEIAAALFFLVKMKRWDVKALDALETWRDKRAKAKGIERKPNVFIQLFRLARERMCARVDLVD